MCLVMDRVKKGYFKKPMQLNVMTKYEAMLQFGLALLSLFKTLIIVTICYVLSSTKSKSAGKFCNYVFCHL